MFPPILAFERVVKHFLVGHQIDDLLQHIYHQHTSGAILQMRLDLPPHLFADSSINVVAELIEYFAAANDSILVSLHYVNAYLQRLPSCSSRLKMRFHQFAHVATGTM
jgi:hypothetical protein